MKKILLCICFLLALPLSMSAAKTDKTTFEIKNGNFYLNGKITQVHSGEFHYARVPHQYWQHRLRMMKAMGLNAVATYVFWNFHEIEPDKWDFTGDRDLASFIRLAGEEGLMVILRPGPYACAEWEFGGFPWWLQNIEGLELRRDNAPFLERTKRYINRLYKEVGSLQCTKGGPIVMVQCENEFGSYVVQRKDIPLAEHKSYNAKLKQQLIDAGFNVPLFTSDGSWLFEGGSTPGALPTANGESDIENLKKTVNQYNGGQGPYMVAEFYPGWLMHWAEKFPYRSPSSIARQTEKYLQNNVSFNFYMVFGGTNFGFTSGANYDKNRDIQPDLTSYDYDAPISEAGWRTPKFDSLRNVMQRYVKKPLPEVPAPAPVVTTAPIKLTKAGNLLTYAQTQPSKESETPLTFEQLNQGYGYMLYSRHFNQPISGTLEIPGLRDYATVYVDGVKVGVLNRNTKTYSMEVDIPFNATLQILVENMGRINYGAEIVRNTKGIISPVKIAGKEIVGEWSMTQFPMDNAPELSKWGSASTSNDANAGKQLAGQPAVYEGTFTLTEVGDMFLDMEPWGKGIVFVNGHNIGRYWQVGPQQTLYVPGPWLKKGENKVVVFEQLNDAPQQVLNSVKEPVLKKLKL